MPRSKNKFICILKMKDGVVEECNLYTNKDDAKEDFTLTALDLGARKDYIDFHISEGYFSGPFGNVFFIRPELRIS